MTATSACFSRTRRPSAKDASVERLLWGNSGALISSLTVTRSPSSDPSMNAAKRL